MSGIRLDAQPAHRSENFRGALLGAGIAVAIAAVAVTVWAGQAEKPARNPTVMLVYVGAEDCAPCRVWQTGEGAAFMASADFPRISYRELKSPHLRDILKDENWPDEIRPYRSSLGPGDGVPLWLLISDREIVERRSGAAEWRASILPKIRSLLRWGKTG